MAKSKKVRKVKKVMANEKKNAALSEQEKRLPKEIQEKLKKIKEKLNTFQEKVLRKFDKYITGIALLPPVRPKEGEKPEDKINVLVLVDDSDSKKMSKFELKEKLTAIINNIAKEVDEKLRVETIIHTEMIQSAFDAKYEILNMIAMSAPIYDTGILGAIKVSEVHKNMVLKKFEKYIVAYVVAGSIMKGKAKPESDIDVYIIVDDTDVKRMTRAELKDKLRAIIIQMAIEAGEITGIRNKLHVQVYILTDFWESLKEAHPVIFTLLRDCVPFYDRGIFVAWKQLLDMGKIKPSPEAIDMFMGSGEQLLKRVDFKLKEIGMEDTFLSILTPTQAAIMLYGLPPPAPGEAAKVVEDIFVKKEKLLEPKYVKILENNYKFRKELEYGKKETVTGKEIDDLLANAKDYLQRIKKLFEQIQERKEKEDIVYVYDTTLSIVRDVLKLEGIPQAKDSEILKLFETELIQKGKIPQNQLRLLEKVIKSKKDYDAGKLTKTEVEQVKKENRSLVKILIEYIQRKRGRELERAKIKVKHGEHFGEILLLDDVAFVIKDIDKPEKEVQKAPIDEKGALGVLEKSSFEELEKEIAEKKIPPKTFIKEPLFESLKKIFGADVEVLMGY
ncbi:hypothetical protein DRJ17_03455 [Candidatus Woesearchaeota archaeon]|nr:MAG: hypothetical protein DRJ17_03455 [Candidatus Woesearchaeota archaeon]